jgi:hypothetical protein
MSSVVASFEESHFLSKVSLVPFSVPEMHRPFQQQQYDPPHHHHPCLTERYRLLWFREHLSLIAVTYFILWSQPESQGLVEQSVLSLRIDGNAPYTHRGQPDLRPNNQRNHKNSTTRRSHFARTRQAQEEPRSPQIVMRREQSAKEMHSGSHSSLMVDRAVPRRDG